MSTDSVSICRSTEGHLVDNGKSEIRYSLQVWWHADDQIIHCFLIDRLSKETLPRRSRSPGIGRENILELFFSRHSDCGSVNQPPRGLVLFTIIQVAVKNHGSNLDRPVQTILHGETFDTTPLKIRGACCVFSLSANLVVTV